MMRRGLVLLEKLVIVESPNKVIKVEGLLSDPKVVPDWSFGLPSLKHISSGPEKVIAMATTGHFMSLKELTWSPVTMNGKPADADFPANGVLANYALEWEVIPGRHIQDTVSHYIQEKAENLSEIVIATDPDREGELIAIHALNLVRSMFPDLKAPFTRAYVHSITADGIRTAMQQRREVFDRNLANAAEARHAMDRVFGFLGSSVVRFANPQMRSIGRVQTPALILIAERERQASEFLAAHKPCFQIKVECSFPARGGTTTHSQVVTVKPRDSDAVKVDWEDEAAVKQWSSRWKLEQSSRFEMAQPPVITANETEPPQPFTMATLIAKANRQLHLTSESVSSCLQDLFQMGHITYPRTDSSRVDETVLPSIYDAVAKAFGKAAVNPLKDGANGRRRPLKGAAKTASAREDNVEDAHEAIRPTDINVKADELGNSIAQNTKLVYDLIRRNTLAAFMNPMKTERVVAEVTASAANGDVIVFTLEGKHTVEPGWSQAFHTGSGKNSRSVAESQLDAEAAEKGAVTVPSISDEEFGAIVDLKETLSRGGGRSGVRLHHAQVLEYRASPPLPYSEGGLIEELRNNGVGRPSTYPMIVKTLLSRNYIEVDKGRCKATEVGRMLVETSKSTFPSIVDIGFTALFERKLDRIAKPEDCDNTFLAAQQNVTEADYVLSSFVSKFLNYVTEATRTQRANIAERSLCLKREQQRDAGPPTEAEIKQARQKAAATVPDLLDNTRMYRTFTALQNSLNDYLRRNFPPSLGAQSGGSGSGSGGGGHLKRKAHTTTTSRKRYTSFTQYTKRKRAAAKVSQGKAVHH